MTNEDIAAALIEIDKSIASTMDAIFSKDTDLAMFHIGVASCHVQHLSKNLKTNQEKTKPQKGN